MNDKAFKQMLRDEHTKALQELVKLKSFRFYMAELLGYCKTFQNAFDEKGNVAAYNNGKQACGQKIFEDIMLISPETYIQMCKEENELIARKDKPEEDSDAKYFETVS